MNLKSLLVTVGLLGSLAAADDSKILLRGATVSLEDMRAVGMARAQVGEIQVTAEVIAFDREKNVLKCGGEVVVRTPSGLVKTKDCVIELSVGQKKVFVLSAGQISISPASATFL